jgi:hypothetical protein
VRNASDIVSRLCEFKHVANRYIDVLRHDANKPKTNEMRDSKSTSELYLMSGRRCSAKIGSNFRG